LKLEDYGAKHGTLASHRWPAGNTAVPFYYGFDEQLQKTVEFLKSGMYLNVDLFGIKKAGEDAMTAPLGSAPFHLAPNEIVQMMVVIQNKNIGHSLVPEVRDLYEPWVEFVVQDAAGKEIYHSGFLKPDGSLDERAHSFTNRPVNIDGSFVDNHKVWTIHSVAYDNTIQSGRSALVRYEFQIPAGVKGPLTVTARVNYRHLRQSYLNNVFGNDHPAYPVVELASRSRTLNIGDNPATPPDPQDNPGLDALEQSRHRVSGSTAIRRFHARLRAGRQAAARLCRRPYQYRPDLYRVGKIFRGAEPPGEGPGAQSQQRARALLSRAGGKARGTLRRGSGRPAKSRDPVSAGPRPAARVGHRLLSAACYEEAKEQFEALQKIDPDDLAAHYNLAVLYRRMGMKDKAAEQAALFATKQVDPAPRLTRWNFCGSIPRFRRRAYPGICTPISRPRRLFPAAEDSFDARSRRRFIRSLSRPRWCFLLPT
jgi:hypothetical protein